MLPPITAALPLKMVMYTRERKESLTPPRMAFLGKSQELIQPLNLEMDMVKLFKMENQKQKKLGIRI